MHVEVVSHATLAKDKRQYVGQVGRIVERYILPDRSQIMFAGGREVILPDAALKPARAPRKR